MLGTGTACPILSRPAVLEWGQGCSLLCDPGMKAAAQGWVFRSMAAM